MYYINFITCCCYTLLLKVHYDKSDAKYTSVLHIAVILTISIFDLVATMTGLFCHKGWLWLTTHGKSFLFMVGAITLVLLLLYHYQIDKKALIKMCERLKKKRLDTGWFCTFITFFPLLFVIVVGVLVFQYFKIEGY